MALRWYSKVAKTLLLLGGAGTCLIGVLPVVRFLSDKGEDVAGEVDPSPAFMGVLIAIFGLLIVTLTFVFFSEKYRKKL